MDKDKIMEKLSGYLPEIYADDDPEIAEALEHAKADPELCQHLEEQCRFDQEFAASLKSIPVDHESMEEFIQLNPYRESNNTISIESGKPSSKRKRLIPLIIASAAALVLGGFAVQYFFFPPAVVFPASENANVNDFREHMAYFATQRFTLEKRTSDWKVSQQWLAEKNSPVYQAAPDHLAKLKSLGCREINWNGTKVSLVCFLNGQKELVHLFIVDRNQLDTRDIDQLKDLNRFHKLETQGWSDSQFVYLLVGSEDDVSIRGLL